MQKYFIIASLVTERYLFLRKRRGIIPMKVSSTPIQASTQFLEDRVKIGPIIIRNKNNKFADDI